MSFDVIQLHLAMNTVTVITADVSHLTAVIG